MKKIIALLLAVYFVGFSSNLFSGTKLSLKKGLMSVGGNIEMHLSFPKSQSAQVGLKIMPEWSYFLAKNFSLDFMGGVENRNISLKMPWQVNLGVGLKYYFDLTKRLKLYLGAGGATSLLGANNNLLVSFAANIPVGLLIPLNSKVALNIGTSLNINFTSDGYKGIDIPMGYLGVRAFI